MLRSPLLSYPARVATENQLQTEGASTANAATHLPPTPIFNSKLGEGRNGRDVSPRKKEEKNSPGKPPLASTSLRSSRMWMGRPPRSALLSCSMAASAMAGSAYVTNLSASSRTSEKQQRTSVTTVDNILPTPTHEENYSKQQSNDGSNTTEGQAPHVCYFSATTASRLHIQTA